MATLRCSVAGCYSAIEVSEAVSEVTEYYCARHFITNPEEGTKFQKYAFDKYLSGIQTSKNGAIYNHKVKLLQLVSLLDGEKISLGQGFQIKTIRQREKEIFSWAIDNKKIAEILLRAFPRLHTDTKQRIKAGRWAQIIRLHFVLGWSFTEVADEMNIRPMIVDRLIKSIKNVAAGKTVDGRERK